MLRSNCERKGDGDSTTAFTNFSFRMVHTQNTDNKEMTANKIVAITREKIGQRRVKI